MSVAGGGFELAAGNDGELLVYSPGTVTSSDNDPSKDDNWAEPFAGSFDHIRIYDRALTEAEIQPLADEF